MKNINKWKPSKFIFKNGKLKSSCNIEEVQISSRLMVDLIAEKYDKYIKKYCRGNLIDLGCGKVPLYEVYKPYITKNICVDWKNTLHKNEYLDLQCDLTKKLPFKDNEFDTIILSDVLEHIPNPEDLFKEINRILKKRGHILLNTPFYYWIHETPYDYYRYTEFALKRFAKNNKFEIIVLETIGGFPEILADILAKNFIKLKLIGKVLASFIQNLAYFLVKKTKIGRKISNDTSSIFPFGYFMVLRKG